MDSVPEALAGGQGPEPKYPLCYWEEGPIDHMEKWIMSWRRKGAASWSGLGIGELGDLGRGRGAGRCRVMGPCAADRARVRGRAFPPKLGWAASLTLALAGPSQAAHRKELSVQLAPLSPTCQRGPGKPERPGTGGHLQPTSEPDTLAPSPCPEPAGPRRGKGGRPSRPEGPRQRPPRAPPAANQRAPREGRGFSYALGRGPRRVGAVEGSRHRCWRVCGTKFLAG